MDKFRNTVWKMVEKRKDKRNERKKTSEDKFDFKRAPFVDEAWWNPSRKEIKMIRSAWMNDQQYQTQFSIDILAYFYTHLPERSKLFPEIWNSGRHWRSSPAFSALAANIQQAIVRTVNYIESPNRIDPYLHEIGGAHCRYVSRGFRAAYWELFKPAVQHVVGNRIDRGVFTTPFTVEQRKQTIELWGCLAVYIVRKMFIGFCDVFSVLDTYYDEHDIKQGPKRHSSGGYRAQGGSSSRRHSATPQAKFFAKSIPSAHSANIDPENRADIM